ncbi:MAG: diacylglycerol kinase family protein [Ginsengibacter sp.]
MEQPLQLKILFILNPVSGGKKKIDWEPLIKSYFKDLPHTIDFFVLSGKDDTSSLKYWFEKLQPQRVVAVGGDGTISLVAKQLLGSKMEMGILPAGSANGMAKELAIPEKPEDAIDVIINGHVKCCDVIAINEDSISFHLSDLGLNARLIKYFDESPLRGMWGYARMVFKVLWRKRLMDAHIVADNLDLDIRAYMIVIANASKYGTGATINPEGDVHDGRFELVVVRKLALSQLFKMFWHSKTFNPKKVEVFQTKEAIITTKRKTHFQVDGEFIGKIDKVTAKIIPSQLNLLVKKEEV